ncbi:hypothetical protein RCL1_005047 [Eukaryota sp. TZLM3-RCL]
MAKAQVEYYFSDSNYLKDKFLLACAASNPEGWIPISTLNTFNRLKAYSLSVSEIAELLKDSAVVAVSEDGLSVRRIAPLPPVDTSKERTIRAKPVPGESTIESIHETFSALGTVLSVKLRRDYQTQKVDSAFIEFSTEEEAKAVIEKASELPYECRLEPLIAYFERKKNKRDNLKTKEKASKQSSKAEKPTEDPDAELQFVSGCVLKLDNLPPSCSREVLTELLSKHSTIGWVDYSKGGSSACVRFSDVSQENVARSVMEKLIAESVKIDNQEPVLSVLEGEDEMLFYLEARDRKISTRAGRKTNRGGARGGFKKRRHD